MEPWVAVLAAVIGGTGVAGIITASVDMSQAARLRRTIENLAVARSHSPKGSDARELADKAIQVETVRMAFLSNARRRPVAWYLTGLVLVLAGTVVAFSGLISDSPWLSDPRLVTFAVGYLIALCGAVCALIWLRASGNERGTHARLVNLGLAEEKRSAPSSESDTRAARRRR